MRLLPAAACGIALRGCAAALPSDLGLGADGPRALDNDAAWALLLGPDWRAELQRRGWDPERPWTAWGVRSREWLHRPGAAPHEDRGAERLALHAARAAFDRAGVRAAQVDLIVVATSTPDRIGSSLSARLAAALKSDAACFDVRAGGAGGVLAWIAAAHWIAAGARSALVVAVEVPSGYLHAGDPSSALLFGDGASALVLERDERRGAGLLAACAGRAPDDGRSFTIPGPLPPEAERCRRGEYRLRAPDGAYLRYLDAAWNELGDSLARSLAALPPAERHLVAGAPTRERATALAQRLELSDAPTRAQLALRGACGAAFPGLVLAHTPYSAGEQLVVAAVGGGLHSAGLLWGV